MVRLIKSMAYALQGIGKAAISERNFILQILAGICVIIAGILFQVTQTEWILLIFWIAGVLSAELFNSALEQLCNLVHPDHHPMVKKVKDFSAGAVLLIATGAAITGGIIFIPRLIAIL